jgi:hypothetical protein
MNSRMTNVKFGWKWTSVVFVTMFASVAAQLQSTPIVVIKSTKAASQSVKTTKSKAATKTTQRTLVASKTVSSLTATFTGTIGAPTTFKTDLQGNCVDWQCPRDCSDSTCWERTFGNGTVSFNVRCALYIQCMDAFCAKDFKFSYDAAVQYVECDKDVTNGVSSLTGDIKPDLNSTYTGTIPLSRVRVWPTDPKIKDTAHLINMNPPRPKLVLAFDNVNTTIIPDGPAPELYNLQPNGMSLETLIIIIVCVVLGVALLALLYFFRDRGYLRWPHPFTKQTQKPSNKRFNSTDDEMMDRGGELHF